MDDKQRLNNIERDVYDLKTRIAVAENNIQDLKKDISSIKENTTWILRLVVGGFVTAVVTFIIKGGLM